MPRMITVYGRTQSLTAWAKETGLGTSTICKRLRKWSPEKTMETPVTAPRSHKASSATPTVRSAATRKAQNRPRWLDLTPPCEMPVRTLNPTALAAVETLAKKEGFRIAYRLIFNTEPLTCAELNEKYRSMGGSAKDAQKLHTHLNILRAMGLIRIIGRRRCRIGGRFTYVHDVTDVVPTTPIVWTKEKKDGRLPPRKHNMTQFGSAHLAPNCAALRSGLKEMRQAFETLKRMGQPLSYRCTEVINFVEQEIKRYEKVTPDNGKVLPFAATR